MDRAYLKYAAEQSERNKAAIGRQAGKKPLGKIGAQ